MIDRVRNWVEGHKEDLFSMYHYLHGNAEISWKETETTKFICQELDKLKIDYHTFSEQTGVVGWMGEEQADGKVIGLRTDMDALWQKVGEEWKANHSCGHDAHMTILLFTLRCLTELDINFNGKIKALFQPAEEMGEGAISFINEHVLDDVDYLLGLHLRPIQEMRMGEASPAIYHGASTIVKGKIYGVQAHAARPHLGINVIDALTNINQSLRMIPLNPVIPASVKMTYVNAGGKNLNIIPDYAEFGLDIRAQTNECMHELMEKVEKMVMATGEASGAKIEMEILASMPAAKPNAYMEDVVTEAIVAVIGEENGVAPPVTPGGEDFHFYAQAKPNLKATMIGLGTDLQPGLHHPDMTFCLDSLLTGVQIMTLATIKLNERLI